jgi:hypothetical protein
LMDPEPETSVRQLYVAAQMPLEKIRKHLGAQSVCSGNR